MKEKVKKNRHIDLRVTESEFALLHEKWKASTFRLFADYFRALVFHTPIVTTCRNKTLDDFQPLIGSIHEELERTRRELTRAVKNLADRPPSAEITGSIKELRAAQISIEENIDEIKNQFIKIYEHVRNV